MECALSLGQGLYLLLRVAVSKSLVWA